MRQHSQGALVATKHRRAKIPAPRAKWERNLLLDYLDLIREAAEDFADVDLATLEKILKPLRREAARIFSANVAYSLPEREAEVIGRARASRLGSKPRGRPRKARHGYGVLGDALIMRRIGEILGEMPRNRRRFGVDEAAEVALAEARDTWKKIDEVWKRRFPKSPLKKPLSLEADVYAARYRRARDRTR